MSIPCRLCRRPDSHVHESDTRVRAARLPPPGFIFKTKRITRIDFALPAVKQSGRWWILRHDQLDRIWPVYQRRRLLLGARHSPEDEQSPEEEQDEND